MAMDFSSIHNMPDEKGKSLLNDIATEELGHVEMIATMIKQLTEGASVEEMKSAGLGDMYSEHGMGVYPSNASGVPYTVAYFAVTGDPIADISEDMAAIISPSPAAFISSTLAPSVNCLIMVAIISTCPSSSVRQR